MGLYKEDRLAGHVTIELSEIIAYFLQESETNKVKVTVNGRRRQELCLVVPRKYCAGSESKRMVKIWGDQLNNKRKIYSFLLAIWRARNVS